MLITLSAQAQRRQALIKTLLQTLIQHLQTHHTMHQIARQMQNGSLYQNFLAMREPHLAILRFSHRAIHLSRKDSLTLQEDSKTIHMILHSLEALIENPLTEMAACLKPKHLSHLFILPRRLLSSA